MQRTILKFVGVSPLAAMTGYLFGSGDWEFWALIASGVWWGAFVLASEGV